MGLNTSANRSASLFSSNSALIMALGLDGVVAYHTQSHGKPFDICLHLGKLGCCHRVYVHDQEVKRKEGPVGGRAF